MLEDPMCTSENGGPNTTAGDMEACTKTIHSINSGIIKMRVLATPDGRRKSATLQLRNAHTVNSNPSYDPLERTEMRMCAHTHIYTRTRTHSHTLQLPGCKQRLQAAINVHTQIHESGRADWTDDITHLVTNPQQDPFIIHLQKNITRYFEKDKRFYQR